MTVEKFYNKNKKSTTYKDEDDYNVDNNYLQFEAKFI